MTSWGYIGIGAFSAIVGLILIGSAGADFTGNVAIVSYIGLLFMVIGGFMLQVGMIAEGVRVGRRSG